MKIKIKKLKNGKYGLYNKKLIAIVPDRALARFYAGRYSDDRSPKVILEECYKQIGVNAFDLKKMKRNAPLWEAALALRRYYICANMRLPKNLINISYILLFGAYK